MEYKVFGGTAVIRIDRGDEIIASIRKVCEKEHIKAGSATGIGAVDRAVIGLYKVEEKKYYPNTLEGEMEMTALAGNVSEKDGEVYLHFHADFAKPDGQVFGGHLSEAVISGTGEVFINIASGKIGRRPDPVTGLNIMDF